MKRLLSELFIFNIFLLSFCSFTAEIVNAENDLKNVETNSIIEINNTWSVVDFGSWDLTNEVSWELKEIPTFFVVTAYYSPLPNQKYYLKWNFEDEVILNWEWIRGASWKKVFSWMLAAPKKYNFWTKIYLEWLWVWEVSDRWWAIVASTWAESRWYEYDRIDIWVWEWEEWLKRALSWWKRVVPWYILIDENKNVDLKLENIKIIESSVKNLVNKPKIYTDYDDIFWKYITPESSENDIKKLQKLMYELDLIKTNNYSWKYIDIKDFLIDYQIKKNIVSKKDDEQAWYFWPKTREKMKNDYLSLQENKKIEKELLIIKNKSELLTNKLIEKIGDVKVWTKWENVKYLQASLKIIWYNNIKVNSKFDYKTKSVIIKYQLEKWIITKDSDVWAGNFWPKTKLSLKKDLSFLLEKNLIKKSPLLLKT